MNDHGDLRIGKPKFIRKFEFTGFRQPRWHEPALRNGGDLPRVRFRILIGQQWEGPRLAGAMARGAVVKQYWSNVLVKRNLRISVADFLRSLGCRKAAHRLRQQEYNQQGNR